MGGVREEGVVKGLEKKKHKRKHGELEDLGGEDVRDVQSDRKKSKREGLNGDNASKVVVDMEAGVSEDTRSRKEKKKERSRLKDGDENKLEKVKAKKSGNGVEEGDSRDEEALDGMDGEELDGKRVKVGGEVIEKARLKKDKKEKKKKNKSEPESNENGDSGRCDVGGHGVEEIRSRKEKKKERSRLKDGDENKLEKVKAKKSGNGVEEGNLRDEEALDGMDGEELDGKRVKVGGEVIEKARLKKDKKEKKKKNKSESESNENGDSGRCDVGGHGGEEIRSRKEKKKEKSKSKGEEDRNNFENMKPKKSGSAVEGGKEASSAVDGEGGDGKSANNSVLMGSKEGGELIETVRLKRDKKEKKKKSKSEPKSNENGDGGRSDSGGQGIEKVNLVENKKRKKKVSGADEEEGVVKKGELSKEVADKEELIDGHKKKKKKNKETDSGASLSNENVRSKDLLHSEGQESHEAVENGVSEKRKKKRLAGTTEEKAAAGVSTVKDGNEPTAPGEKSKSAKKSGRVTFAESVEVFPLSDNPSEEEDNLVDEGHSSNGLEMENLADPDGIVRGKRYSKEEDEMVKQAVYKYIEDHQLGEEGLEMVLHCKKHNKKVRGCWNVIAAEMPWRQKQSIYFRAHILFERSESRTWSKEELEEVRQFHEKYGPKWRTLADEIGRNRIHVKDAFRQIRLANRKDGAWSQDEYQSLFDSVNESLRIRACMDRKTQHGMLRENIGWRDISSKLGTRTDPICCMKWYDQLTSTLVSSGQWADTDDHRLLMALVEVDATCEEEVDWNNILEHRPGDVSRKRWNQMVRHIGEHGTKSFSEQVEILHKRYVPDVLEARETYDSKPFADALF